MPPNTVAVCAGAQEAVIPYRYQSPTHVAAGQFGCVCAIPILSWNAGGSTIRGYPDQILVHGFPRRPGPGFALSW